MPIITVKVFEGELTKNRTAEIIADITEAVIRQNAPPDQQPYSRRERTNNRREKS